MENSQDLSVGYTAARAWLAGRNPYDPEVLADEISRGGNPQWAAAGRMDLLLNIYFPSSLPIYLPLALFQWGTAKALWLGVNVAAIACILFGLIRNFGWRITENRSLGLIAFFLALSPVHSTTAHGQTAILSTAAVVGALLLEQTSRHRAAGVAYGLATLIKAQIGLPFIAYILWRRRWRASAWAAITIVAFSALSVGRMEAGNVDWAQRWTNNLSVTTTDGGHNDSSRSNPARHSLLNLQYPLHEVIDNHHAVNAIVIALVGLGVLATLGLIRGQYPDQELLALALVSLLSLLVSYHRTYDAVVLALPLAWAVAALRTTWRHGVVVLLLCADFVLPMQTMLFVWEHRFPDWLTGNLFWRMVMLAQQVWAVVFIILVMLDAARRNRIADGRFGSSRVEGQGALIRLS